MKKQLLLVLFLAIFAGISNGYAQCTPDALHPGVGIEYDYAAIISGVGYDGTNASQYDWYISQNVNILDGASILDVADGFFTVNAATPISPSCNGR
ncbi:MAG: hypothetical protein IPF68_20350 [Bacteroidales bacterium]|nr:hypothetical protein [Bacteroidales bacterium]